MKKINNPTLEAIQSNVKTTETQELDYSRENLFKGTWKDFEIADLQPNLIPDGWDSFVRYGSGEVLFKSDFTENWRVQKILGAEGNHGNGVINKTNDIGRYDMWYNIGDIEAPVFVTVEIKTKGKKDFRFGFGGVGGSSQEVVLKGDDVFHTYDFSADNVGNGNILMGAISEGKYELRNLQLSDSDNRHLVVEKTPLGNGLTRIQTWGGNHTVKLMLNKGKSFEEEYNWSFYAKNIGLKNVIFRSNQGLETETLEDENEKYISLNSDKDHPNYLQFHVRAEDTDDNLDFIASDPQIVEGDKHNPVLVVDQLDDGREHVQVYGAYPDTKLVYKGGEGFIGEEYVLKTNIENKGIGLSIKTPLSDDLTYIGKGENQVNIQGELKEKLSIEVGIPNE